MKRIWIGIIIITSLLLALPAFAQDGGYTAEEQSNLDAVGGMFAAFDAGDMEAVLGSMSEDVVWEINGSRDANPLHGAWNGRDEVSAWFDMLFSKVEMMDFGVDGMWADGDVVFVLAHNSGRMISTGILVNQQEMMVFWLADGMVVRMLDFDDSAQEYMAMHPEEGEDEDDDDDGED